MNGESLNIQQDNLNKLKEQFPNLFTEDKLDWEKLKATFSDYINFSNERYILNWAGKADAFKALQIPTTATLKPAPDESINFDRTENIFIEGENLEVLKVLQKSYYNKIKCIIIDPPYNTGGDSFIYPDSFKESKEDYQKRIGDKDEEGYLMKEGMFRKNNKDSGHFHSNWLNMMYPRLFLAKNLLSDEGVIFVHIDDNEVHNLRLIMNEVFGEENFFAQIIVRSNSRGQTYKQIAKTHEYVLVYTKNFETELFELEKDEANNDLNLKDNIGNYNIRELRNRNPKFGKHNRPNLFYPIYVNPNQFDADGFYPISLEKNDDYTSEVLPLNSEKKESCWRWGKSKCLVNLNEVTLSSNLVAKKKNDNSFGIYEKYRKTTYKPKSIWDNNGFLTETGTVELRELELENAFDFPKPVELEKQILNLAMEDDDIVLDFFAGSSTVGQAVLELNKKDGGSRKFILIQLPEPIDEKADASKLGFKVISDVSKERIRRVISKIQDEDRQETSKRKMEIDFKNHNKINGEIDLGFKVFKLIPSNFKIWRSNEINEGNLVQQLEAFANPAHANSPEQNMLCELILKSGYLLTDKVTKFDVVNEGGDESKHIQTCFYIIAEGDLIIALDNISSHIIELIINEAPKKVIMLDSLFAGNDQLKTNTVLQMKDAGIDFKTI